MCCRSGSISCAVATEKKNSKKKKKKKKRFKELTVLEKSEFSPSFLKFVFDQFGQRLSTVSVASRH